MPAPVKVTPGQSFGRLTVIRDAPGRRTRGGAMKRRIECRCDCGSVVTVDLAQVRQGKTRSCGCLQSQEAAERFTTHGMRRAPEYRVWSGILTRCLNPNDATFQKYGAKGVTVCERWRSFAAFYEDMGPRPSSLHSIDRIDNARGYEPGNCRWATVREQARNKTSNKLTEADAQSIREAYAAGAARNVLAKRYGVSWKMVNFIVKGESWA